MTPRQRQNFAIEVEILKKIGRHNFVVEFFGLSFDPGPDVCLITLFL